MLHVLLMTALSIIQTVVVTVREDVHCNYQHIYIYINCNERHLCSLNKAFSVCMKTHYLFSRVWANVNINNNECTISFTDSGFICSHIWKGRFLAKMSILASIEAMLKIQYFQQVVGHIMKTYIYAYHDLVESQCSLRKLRFSVPSPSIYLVWPDCSAHSLSRP